MSSPFAYTPLVYEFLLHAGYVTTAKALSKETGQDLVRKGKWGMFGMSHAHLLRQASRIELCRFDLSSYQIRGEKRDLVRVFVPKLSYIISQFSCVHGKRK